MEQVKKAFRYINPFLKASNNSSYLGNGYWNNPLSVDPSELNDVTHLKVGSGNTTIKLNDEGLFIGANKFSQAPIRISPSGNFIHNDGENDRILIGTFE